MLALRPNLHLWNIPVKQVCFSVRKMDSSVSGQAIWRGMCWECSKRQKERLIDGHITHSKFHQHLLPRDGNLGKVKRSQVIFK